MKTEALIYVSLAPGKCAEVAVRIVEEGLPTPHEGCSMREPTLSELEEVTSMLAATHPTTMPPFPIVRPSWRKPVPAGAPKPPPEVPQPDPATRTMSPRRPARKSIWSRIFS